MPLKIRQKQTGVERTVNVRDWDNPKEYNQDRWDIVEMQDVCRLYWHNPETKNRQELPRIEKSHALNILKDWPNDYEFEEIPSFGRDLESLPTITPKAYTAIKRAKTAIYKYKDNLWVITIFGGLIVLIVGSYFLKKMGII